jgi:hypothetical protein
MRALGNSFGVFGWAVGCGTTTLVIPSMFSSLGWRTLIVFGAFNFCSLPLVFFFFPETKGKSLEEINLLFSSSSPIVSENKEAYRRMLEEAGGHVAVAERRMMEEVDGHAEDDRKESVSSDEEYQLEPKVAV